MEELIQSWWPTIMVTVSGVVSPIAGTYVSTKLLKQRMDNIESAHKDCRIERKKFERDTIEKVSGLSSEVSFIKGKMNGALK